MQHELLLKEITHRIIAVSILTLLLVLLIAFLKEINREDPLRGTLELAIAMIALCAFAALMAAEFKPQDDSATICISMVGHRRQSRASDGNRNALNTSEERKWA